MSGLVVSFIATSCRLWFGVHISIRSWRFRFCLHSHFHFLYIILILYYCCFFGHWSYAFHNSPPCFSQRSQYLKKMYISQARSSLVANVTRYRRCYAYELSSLIGSLQQFRCIFRYLCWVWSSFIGFFFDDDRLNLSDHVSWFVNRDMQRLTSPFVAHRRELAYFPLHRRTRRTKNFLSGRE